MFTKTVAVASLLAVGMPIVPASANVRQAAFEASGDWQHGRTALFAGATIRVGLDDRGERRAQTALRFAPARLAGADGLRVGEGVAYRLTGAKAHRLTISGQETRQIERKLRLSGTETALVVGGVLLLALVIAAATADFDGAADGLSNH